MHFPRKIPQTYSEPVDMVKRKSAAVSKLLSNKIAALSPFLLIDSLISPSRALKMSKCDPNAAKVL